MYVLPKKKSLKDKRVFFFSLDMSYILGILQSGFKEVREGLAV
jgi:hypothetical protein